MKRITYWLLYLYPRSWRDRYGAELHALLEDAGTRPQDLFDITTGAIKKLGKAFVLAAAMVVGTVGGLARTYALPTREFRSATTLRMAFQPGDSLPFNAIQNALDRKALQEVIHRNNLYPNERSSQPLEQVVEKMRRSIWVRKAPDPAPELQLAFIYRDPAIAQKVTSDLTTALVREAVNTGSAKSIRTEPSPTIPLRPLRMALPFAGPLLGLIAGTFAILRATSLPPAARY